MGKRRGEKRLGVERNVFISQGGKIEGKREKTTGERGDGDWRRVKGEGKKQKGV